MIVYPPRRVRFRRPLLRGWARRVVLGAGGLMVLTAALMAVALAGCQGGPQQAGSGVLEKPFPAEPVVRIRIAKSAYTFTIDGPATVNIGAPYGEDRAVYARAFATPVVIRHHKGEFLIRPQSGQAMSWALPSLRIEPGSGDTLKLNGNAYPVALVVYPVSSGGSGVDLPMDAINHLPIEAYLPGVLHKEMYQKWHPEAFRAQAIVARSYALAQFERTKKHRFDLESTQASQAYAGAGAHDKAHAGVVGTRGMVLSYQGKVLPAYYSSCIGGVSQDAAAVFPDQPDLPPLRGRVVGNWGQTSPYYRWGPIDRNRSTLTQRIAGWGRERTHPARFLKSISDIRVTTRNAVGRPTRFAVYDSAGEAYSMNAEEFRFACNWKGSGAADLPDAQLLRSSFVNIQVAGEQVRFEGRGFGHGVGLGQYGAQEMALRGYRAESIVAFYYPGAPLARAY